MTQVMRRGMAWVESRFKESTRPAKRNQVVSFVSDLKRSKRKLIAENMFLRQQLIVLERQIVRPELTQHDRCVLVLLASRIQGWREALVVVKREAGHVVAVAQRRFSIVLAAEITGKERASPDST